MCHPRFSFISLSNGSNWFCCRRGSPPVMTTLVIFMASNVAIISSTDIDVTSTWGSYTCPFFPVQSQVKDESHQLQVRLHPPNRTKAHKRPRDGPSPWMLLKISEIASGCMVTPRIGFDRADLQRRTLPCVRCRHHIYRSGQCLHCNRCRHL